MFLEAENRRGVRSSWKKWTGRPERACARDV